MAIDKVFPSFAAAVADIPDGAVMLIDGFGGAGGMPSYLITAMRDHGAKNLTVVSNSLGLPGFGTRSEAELVDTSILFANHQVKKAYASFPVPRSPNVVTPFIEALRRGEVVLEVVPQGTLVERVRAAGAGIGAFYTPTGVGTDVENGKEKKTINDKEYILEYAIKGDYALIRAHIADRLGNLVYRMTSRNMNPIWATAARVTIAEVDEIVEPGELDPETIVTPCVYVHRIVKRPNKTRGTEA
ncbi:MAG: 3-oxoacid CoA-transferase subunit A [Chloroflexi bacterium]|nr:3-oxoacid CoA-transferase subunit A [Chloroflexota bacterium]